MDEFIWAKRYMYITSGVPVQEWACLACCCCCCHLYKDLVLPATSVTQHQSYSIDTRTIVYSSRDGGHIYCSIPTGCQVRYGLVSRGHDSCRGLANRSDSYLKTHMPLVQEKWVCQRSVPFDLMALWHAGAILSSTLLIAFLAGSPRSHILEGT